MENLDHDPRPNDTSRRVLADFIDFAPLFPPALHPPAAALQHYLKAQQGRRRSTLHTLVWPFHRLEELDGGGENAISLAGLFDSNGLGVPIHSGLGTIANDAQDATFLITQLEGPVPADPDSRSATFASLTDFDGPCFFELGVAGHDPRTVEAAVADLARHRDATATTSAVTIGAKVRCGGVDPRSVPSPAELASFVVACARHGLPFKATAGLHHAWPDWDGGPARHGLAALLLAVDLATSGAPAKVVADRLSDPQPTHLPEAAIRRARRLFASIGSCSFDEPLDELEDWIADDDPVAPNGEHPTETGDIGAQQVNA